MKDIMSPEYIKEELSKKKKRLMPLLNKEMPKECIQGFSKITELAGLSDYFEDNYRFYYYEDYMPMMGRVYRLYISDLVKIAEDLYKINLDNIKTSREELLCSLISKHQIISVYYDDSDVLGYIGQPYFEIYDGNDIERFLEDEIEDLAKKAVKILKDKRNNCFII